MALVTEPRTLAVLALAQLSLDAGEGHRLCFGRSVEKRERGVSVNDCFVLGLDNQGPDVFEEVRRFVARSGLMDVQVTVLTPFPGTPLYARLFRERRLLQERFWDRCTLFDVNFVPARMSAGDLEQGMQFLFRELYTRAAARRRRRRFVNGRERTAAVS